MKQTTEIDARKFAAVVDLMRVSFPSKAELMASKKLIPECVENLYELWAVAHEEAMELAVRLPEVFGDPPRPAITPHVARAFDDEWIVPMERGLELTAKDPEQHWWELTAEAARCFHEYFTFSDPEGWRFYIPAYLRHYLATFPLNNYDAVREACESRRYFDLLTPAQIAFIDEYLALCRTWQ
jgi:hypothetical protein